MSEPLLLFNRWSLADVAVEDAGLRNYITLQPVVIPRSGGRFGPEAMHKNRMNIVERLMNKMMIPGHKGKKHAITSGRAVGNSITLYNNLRKAFEIIEKKTGKNPIQVLVKAVENSAALEEVAAYRLGGIIARKSVVISPQRRINIALRHLAQGIYKAKFKNKTPLPEVIASELLAAAGSDPKCFPIMEKNRLEKEAEGAR
jgi:small subunit ribosomal protein S7